jgi:tRNA(Ile)-lysidine synthase
MGDRLELAFRREAERLLPAGARVLVAVSGGGDSIALLNLLARRARGREPGAWVAHLDHALREDSVGDRQFVERRAAELGLPCIARRRDVARRRRRDESPEEAARRVRREFLLEVAARVGAERIALGHTLDDQAETILMRLVRGAGVTALTGMASSGPGPFVRPLLRFERAELRGWLAKHELAWREDPSNEELRFDRNRVRRLVMPLVAATLNPRAPRHLVRAADRLREDAALLDAIAATKLEQASGHASCTIEARGISAEPRPIARRMARLLLARAGADARRIGSCHVEELVALAAGPRGRRVDLPGGLSARRTTRHVVVEARR